MMGAHYKDTTPLYKKEGRRYVVACNIESVWEYGITPDTAGFIAAAMVAEVARMDGAGAAGRHADFGSDGKMKTEKTPHPAAHLLRAIADGEQMQVLVSHTPTEWRDCDNPSRAIRMLGTEYDSAPDDVVRVKPQESAATLASQHASIAAMEREMIAMASDWTAKNRHIDALEARIAELEDNLKRAMSAIPLTEAQQ